MLMEKAPNLKIMKWLSFGGKNEEKLPKYFFAFALVIFPVFFVMHMLFATGTVTYDLHSFAVDKDGALYLGRDRKIEVMIENSVLRSISPQTSGKYAFTIGSKNNIVLSTATYVYTIDLQGNVLTKEEDIDNKTLHQLTYQSATDISPDGNTYEKKDFLGCYYIVRLGTDGETVIYSMPIHEYLLKLIYIASIISFVILALSVLVKNRAIFIRLWKGKG